MEGEPYEVLESSPMKKAQRRVTIQARIKNLISGSAVERNFHQSETFEEAEILKFEAKFLYSHREKYFFCEVEEGSSSPPSAKASLKENPSVRFELDKKIVGDMSKFLKPNQIIEGMRFNGKIIKIALPIKIQLRVVEAPPGVKGDRAQGGTKPVTLETGTIINAPLFIEAGDIVEINTETGEYVKRVEEH